MIAFRNFLPLLQISPERLVPVRADWLCSSLQLAADRAGYLRWWLAEHVAASVLNYLVDYFESNTIRPAEVNDIVRAALQTIGYAEIALQFELADPPLEMSLLDVAQEAGYGFELAFFQLLNARVELILRDAPGIVQVHGIEHCVRYLQKTKTWSRSCSRLRNEIVDFLRAQIERQQPRSGFLLTIR